MRQSQLFSFGCTQNITVEQKTALSTLLNNAEARIKAKEFRSDEVKRVYLEYIAYHCNQLNSNAGHFVSVSKFIIFPFKTLAEENDFKEINFLEVFLDALSILIFSDATIEFQENHLNISIESRTIYGIYYRAGNYSLKDQYIKLLKELKEKRVALPSNFTAFILGCPDAIRLDKEKMNRIVVDILSSMPYIKNLQESNPACISPTASIISECDSIADAEKLVKDLLK